VLNVRLKDREYQALKEEAKKRGVPLSTAARMLMLEGLAANNPTVQARNLLRAIEGDLDLRLALRRLVLMDPTN